MVKQMNDYPCQCTHKFSDHFEIEFRKRESDWPCLVCVGCSNYESMNNIEYLEMKAAGEI
jgi:hypothetical protein